MKLYNYKLSELGFRVQASQANMPASCYGSWNYLNLGLFLGRPHASMISERSKDILDLLVRYEKIHTGETMRSEGRQRMASLRKSAALLNFCMETFRAGLILKRRKTAQCRELDRYASNPDGYVWLSMADQRLERLFDRRACEEEIKDVIVISASKFRFATVTKAAKKWEEVFLNQFLGTYTPSKAAQEAIHAAYVKIGGSNG